MKSFRKFILEHNLEIRTREIINHLFLSHSDPMTKFVQDLVRFLPLDPKNPNRIDVLRLYAAEFKENFNELIEDPAVLILNRLHQAYIVDNRENQTDQNHLRRMINFLNREFDQNKNESELWKIYKKLVPFDGEDYR